MGQLPTTGPTMSWFSPPYDDRAQAGHELAAHVQQVVSDAVPLVLGLPRGGVVVAAALARATAWPLDVLVVRKVAAPDQPEFAIAAVGEGGVVVHNLGSGRHRATEAALASEHARVDHLVAQFRHGEPLSLDGRTVVIVDDGIATGATARAAVAVARARGADRVIVAAPIGSPRVVQVLEEEADVVIVVHQPRAFQAVGEGYRDFTQVSTEEVRRLLSRRDDRGCLPAA
jgi:putative phosphoribosyl transferase